MSDEVTGTAPTPESKCPVCRGSGFNGFDACICQYPIKPESKPTSEGARAFAEKWLGERYVEKYPGQVVHEVSVQMAVDLAEAYAAPFRSQLAAAEKERDEARSLIPHPGDGSCDHCGKIPAIDIPTRLCDECSDGVKRADAAESEIQRLRERIAELEGSKKAW